ncbi:ferric reductase-like transmembrane domain-containing protein [Castellaniella sp.]|uniref:ferredoxin reductase family protein n=1 Tax=Castellaniella sp. TaxID=1955812 RepID=UPI00356A7766
MKTRHFLILFLGLIGLAWAWDALVVHPMAGDAAWVVRKQLIYFTGVASMGLMSLVMVLATRPVWLESWLGGMDRIFQLHKRAGILAISLGVAHWLVKISKGALISVLGAIVDKPASLPLLEAFQSSKGLAKDVGEWVIYALILTLVLTLWKVVPYKAWRLVHKVMPVLYLALVFHAVVLMPAVWWTQPLGLLMGGLLVAGSLAAVSALRQRIGHRRRHAGVVESVTRQASGVTEVRCVMAADWPGHVAGQFAFVQFDRSEGFHPFTIADADRGAARRLTFQIKALGDYTSRLAQQLHPGQHVLVEGPYGRFDHTRGDREQIWVAGGIGITPFVAWLESLQDTPDKAPQAHLHYCIRDAAQDPFVPRLRALCARLPQIRLQIHEARAGQRLDAGTLRADWKAGGGVMPEIWFCGPVGLARHLEDGLRALGLDRVRWHREAFDMR